MSVLEIGAKMVEMVNAGPESEAKFVDEYYSDSVVSIEGQGSDEMPAKMEGLDAIRGKHEWWYGNHEVHSAVATGPYVGNKEDQFVIRFNMDLTPNDGERGQMEEVGVFTVKDGKVVQEEFLYLMG